MTSLINELLKHEGFNKYFKNTMWQIFEKITRIFVSIFVGSWIARYLGPSNYGDLNYAQSIIAVVTSLTGLGLDNLLMREFSKSSVSKNEIFNTCIVMRFVFSSIVFILLNISVFLSGKTVLIHIFSILIILQTIEVIDFLFLSDAAGKMSSMSKMIGFFVGAIAKMTCIFLKLDINYIAMCFVLDSIIVALSLFKYFNKSRVALKLSDYKNDLAFSILNESWPLMLTAMLLMIQAKIDQLMIQHINGSLEVGYYSSALRIIELFGFLPMLINTSLYPALVRARERCQDLYKNRFINYYRLTFLIFLFIALPVFIFSNYIVEILLGPQYRDSAQLLSLMCVRLFFTNHGVARSSFITIEGQQKFGMVTMLIGTIVNIILNLILIPIYQSKGAIISTIVSFFVTIFLLDVINKKTRKNVIWQMNAIITFYKIKIKDVL